MPIPVAEQSKAWVCGRSLAGIAGSNAAGAVDDCLLWVLCAVRYRPLRRADPSSRGVLPSVVCLSVIVKPWQGWGLGQLELSSHAIYILLWIYIINYKHVVIIKSVIFYFLRKWKLTNSISCRSLIYFSGQKISTYDSLHDCWSP